MRVSYFMLPLIATAHEIPGLYTKCAATDEIMSTPSFGTKGAVLTVCAQSTIQGSPSEIYNVLIDFPRYHEWNTFVYEVQDLPSNVTSAEDVYVGMPMTFRTFGLVPVTNSTSYEVVSYLEPDYETPFSAWGTDYGMGLAGLQAEHVNVLRDLGNGMTEYVSWETFYGAGATAVLPLKDALVTQFEKQGQDLKTRVEGMD
ncbi:uncharacterized protein RAG0_15703 [Rhynchosporium agropyri]|uniref:Uncharacterized protein n=1 Tax=Rhynchosporium agropyri TaxID=914238 RepID=A0A1E1LMB8_9HELO|nr:uncharacterized protein RAG0_15703 [Rhynchosporium agropyri]